MGVAKEQIKAAATKKVKKLAAKQLLAWVGLPTILMVVAGIGLVFFVVLLIVGVAADNQQNTTLDCPPGQVYKISDNLTPGKTPVLKDTVDPLAGGVGSQGWSGQQLIHAKMIAITGEAMGFDRSGVVIAIMVAMGESSLKNINYGDDIFGVKNPDGTPTSSIGLFQQQKWWEPMELLGRSPAEGEPGFGQPFGLARLDPYYAAQSFFNALAAVPDWRTLEPTIAGHRVQKNADPQHYAKYFTDAQAVYDSLSLVSLASVPSQLVVSGCIQNLGGFSPGVVSDSGWALPVLGAKSTSGYGPRNTGIPGASKFHEGADLGVACGTPVYAVYAGVVVQAGLRGGAWSGLGNFVEIDHGLNSEGKRITTRSAHLSTGQIYVAAGQSVAPGQVIAGSGGDKKSDPLGAGTSSGCHLHFEVRVDGKATNPIVWLGSRGITF